MSKLNRRDMLPPRHITSKYGRLWPPLGWAVPPGCLQANHVRLPWYATCLYPAVGLTESISCGESPKKLPVLPRRFYRLPGGISGLTEGRAPVTPPSLGRRGRLIGQKRRSL